jgi:hypothetical protein
MALTNAERQRKWRQRQQETNLNSFGRWFSPGTPASSTTKTGRHDIAEILLKVALNTKKSKKSKIK